MISPERVLEHIVGQSGVVTVSPILEEWMKMIQLVLVGRIQEQVRRTVEERVDVRIKQTKDRIQQHIVKEIVGTVASQIG